MFRLYTALNLIAAVVWTLLLLETHPRLHSPLSDYGAPIGLLSLFFLLPAAVIVLRRLRKRNAQPASRRRKTYFLVSNIFLTVTWLMSVTNLYCRESWEFGDGMTYRMRFRFEDEAVLETIRNALRLEPVPETEAQSSWVMERDGPGWWPSRKEARYQRVFRGRDRRPRLWVDLDNRIAYYRSGP